MNIRTTRQQGAGLICLPELHPTGYASRRAWEMLQELHPKKELGEL